MRYILLCLIFLSSFAYAGGAGGSWGGDDGGYDGEGGSTGGGGAGGSWKQCVYIGVQLKEFDSLNEAARYNCSLLNYSFTHVEWSDANNWWFVRAQDNAGRKQNCWSVRMRCDKPESEPKPEPEPEPKLDPKCGKNQHLENGICVNDKPQDCDPNIQDCDKDGKPKCDCCDKLDTIIGNQQTQISNQSTIIDQIHNVNSSIQTTNSKLDAIERAILNKKFSADINTDELERKLDEIKQAIIDKKLEQQDLSELQQVLNDILRAINDKEVDLRPTIAKLDEILQSIKAIDINEVTKRQDEANEKLQNLDDTLRELDRDGEQSGILNDIRNMIKEFMKRPEPEHNDDNSNNNDNPDNNKINAEIDPWKAIRGFDIHQNRINAQAQCPSNQNYAFVIMGTQFVMPVEIFCDALAKLAPAFLFIAYMSGAYIIIKGGD